MEARRADEPVAYKDWLKQHPIPDPGELPFRPKITVVVEHALPTDAAAEGAVAATVDSVTAQRGVDAAAVPAPSGSSLATAVSRRPETELLLVLRAGSVLHPGALAALTARFWTNPAARVVGFDSDLLEGRGRRHSPLFRPAWSPDMLLGANYFGRAFAVRAGSVDASGLSVDDHGVWRLLLAADFRDDDVDRLPAVLLSERERPLCAASEADAGMVADELARRGTPAETSVEHGVVRVRFTPPAWPSVSIVVPTRHSRRNLEALLPGLLASDYPAFDVTVVDNGERNAANEGWYDALKSPVPFAVRWWSEAPFNYSRVNTVTAAATGGDVLVLLNDDTEIVDDGWLRELVGVLLRDGVGTAGFQLRRQDGSIQHGGVTLGPGGFADNLFSGIPPHSDTLLGPTDWYRDSLAVTAACVAIRRADFDEAGGLDEQFVLCGSDVVLGLDQVIAGRRNVVIPFDAVRHNESVTRGTAVPRGDFFASYWRYRPWLDSGDPFSSPNVSPLSARPRLSQPGEASPLQLALESLGRPFRDNSQKATISEDATSLLHVAGISAAQVERVRAVHAELVGRREVRTVNWYLPEFELPFFGGVNTALRLAAKLKRDHGVQNTFVIQCGPNPEFFASAIAAAFPELAGSRIVFNDGSAESLAAIPPADAGVATFWLTAISLAKTPGVARKFYLIQDYEPGFYPASAMFAMTEQSYRLGLYGICNTTSLHAIYAGGYGGTATAFDPAVDRRIYHAEQRRAPAPDDPLTVFAYARDHFRNCSEIVFAALHELKRRHGEKVRIVAAGAEHLREGADFLDLGLLDYRATGRLYRATDIGVTLQVSRHPSYLPLELMACGVPVVAADSPWFHWLFEHDVNAATAMPTFDDVVRQLDRLVTDAAFRASVATAGTATIDAAHSDWDGALAHIYDFLCDPEATAIPARPGLGIAP